MTKIRCLRCNRRQRSGIGWNVELHQGLPVFYLCPDCQTPEETAEARINEATLVYGRDAFGRSIGRPRVGGAWT